MNKGARDDSETVWELKDDHDHMTTQKIKVERYVESEEVNKTLVTLCYYGKCTVICLEDFVEEKFNDLDLARLERR